MKNPYLSLLRTSWKYAGADRRKVVLIYAMFILANIIISLNPILLGWFVGKAQSDSDMIPKYALMYVSGYFLLKLLEWSLHGPARIMERTVAFQIGRNFLQEKYHQTLHLHPKWHQDNHSGSTINSIRKSHEALRDFFDKGFTYLYTITKFTFSVTAIVWFSPLFGSIAVALGILTVWVISNFDKPFIRTLREVNARENGVSANLFDSLSNIRTVITLRLEKSMESGLLRKMSQVFAPFRKNAVINEWKWFVAEMMITLIYTVIVFGFIYQRWQPGSVFYVAGLVTLLGYVNQFTSVFQNVAGQYSGLVQYNTNLHGVAGIEEAFKQQHRPDTNPAFPAGWKKITLDNISYSHRLTYDEQFRPQSLHKLLINIEKGKKIALIGESGSGKSTLLSLLRGLYQPKEGAQMIIDGSEFPIDALNNKVTLFPQEPEVFEETIAFNITLGLTHSEEDILEACRVAAFADVVQQMPEGLMTDIREKGVNLSGGQKQRLALARGILAAKDSEVILLDEPTSSVDPRTEQIIYARMFDIFRDKAVISSIHRLHLLEQFDYIYILEQGRIVDEGSFDELFAGSEAFRDRWEHQKGMVAKVA